MGQREDIARRHQSSKVSKNQEGVRLAWVYLPVPVITGGMPRADAAGLARRLARSSRTLEGERRNTPKPKLGA